MDDPLGQPLFSNDVPPNASAEISALLQGILTTIPTNLTILDETGRIIAVNRAWREFAHTNGFSDPASGIGKDYLTAWAAQVGMDADFVCAAAEGLRQILAEERPTFTLEYPCHSLHQQRWYLMRAFGVHTTGKRYGVVLEEDITERVLADEQARLLARFSDENPSPVLRMAIDGQILFANDAAAQLLERWGRDAEGKVLEPWRERLRTAFDLAQTMRLEVAVGAKIYLLEIVPIAASNCVNVYGCDITEEKRAGEQVRKLSRAVEQSPSVIEITDADGRIEYVNPRFTELTGYALEEAVGQKPSILKSGETPAEEYDRLWRTITSGGTWRGEFHNRKKNGELFWEASVICGIKDAQGRITHFVAVKEDITKRKQAEQSLAEERSLLRTLIDNLPDYIYVKDTHSRMMGSNQAQAALLGVAEPDETLGKTDFDFFAHFEAERFFADEQAILQTGQALLHREESATDQTTGQVRWLDTTKVPLRDSSGNIIGIVGMGRDITERKRAEGRLHESERRYHSLFEHMLNGFAYCQMEFEQGHPQDFIYLDVNAAFETQTGLKNVVGKKVSEVIPGIRETDPELLEIYGRVATTGQPEQFETYVEALGMWFSIVVYSPQPGYFVAVFDVITERKQVEAALRESEIRYRRLFEAAKDGVLILDAETGQILDVNPFLIDLLGYSHEEFLGKKIWEIGVFRDVAASQAAFGELVRAGYVRYDDLPLETGDGRQIAVEFVSNAYQAAGKTTIQCNIRDITERKQIEKALAQERSLLRTVIDNIPDLIFAKDGAGRFILANGAVLTSMRAASPDEVIGKTDFDVSPPELAESYSADDQQVIASGQPLLNREEATIDAHGETRWSLTTKVPLRDSAGNVTGLVGIGRDITERKQAQEALQVLNADLERQVSERTAQYQRAKERTEAILNSSADAIILCRTKGTIDQANQAFDTIFGHRSNEVLDQPLVSLIIPHDIPTVERAFSAVLETRQPQRLEVTIQRKDGATFAADVMLSPVIREDFTLAGVVCILRDITERKRIEDKLREALTKEQELNVLQTRFTSMVSHDIRTPLAVISSSAEILHDYYDRMDEVTRARHFERIGAQVARMVELLTDVLTISRADAGAMPFNPVLLDLNLYCRKLIEEFQNNPSTKHLVVYSAPDEPIPTPADEKLLYQALTNLLRNAIKYSPEGSTIRLDLAREEHEAILRIADSGIGIPEADLPHLFEPFHRASNVGQVEGTGLGLAIVQRSIAAHSGTITCESQVGVGTTFTVRLPTAVGTEGSST